MGVGTPSQLVLWLLLRSHGIKDIVLMRGQSEKQKEHWMFQNRGNAVQRMGYIDVEGYRVKKTHQDNPDIGESRMQLPL